MGAGDDDDIELETLEPAGVEHPTGPGSGTPRPGRRGLLLIGAIALGVLATCLLLALSDIHRLHQRLYRLQAERPSATTTSTIPGPEERFCTSFPLVGQVTFTPAELVGTSYASAGHIGGAVGGLPPNRYVRIEFWDTTSGPRVVAQVGARTNANGALQLGGPSLAGLAPISEVFFRFGTNDRDLRMFGPPAIPC